MNCKPLLFSSFFAMMIKKSASWCAMRKRIYEIIEPGKNGSRLSRVYDIVMLCTILVSLIPLTVRTVTPILLWLDVVTAAVFIADYLLRLCTADLRLKKSAASFFLYPFTGQPSLSPPLATAISIP